MSERPAQALEGLFHERFFYNDLISSHDDPQLTSANLMAMLAFPGLLTLFWLPKYYVVLASAPEYVRQWHALGDRFVWIAFSMTTLALLATLQWESLLPDRRDMLILGPQPVSARQVLYAQVRALARYLGLFFVLINVCALLFYPLAAIPWRSSLAEGLWFTIANAVAVAAAAAFAFFAVAGVQSLFLLALPASLFRRVSQWVQLLLAAGLCAALILLFALNEIAVRGATTAAEIANTTIAFWLPPMWFAGFGAWLASGAQAFEPMALLATTSLAVAIALTAAGYALSYRRFGALVLESPTSGRGDARRPLPRWRRLGLGDPAERAIFLFTLRTLLRSPLHRLRLGVFVGIGAAFVVIRAWGADPSLPSAAMLEGPFALLFLCVVGLRSAYQLPAELPANWAFRFHTDGSRLQRYLTGARKAVWVAGPGPLVLLSSAAMAQAWGANVALPHAAALTMATWLVVEAAQTGVRKIPFTCNFVAPRAHIIIVWTMGAVAMMTFASSFASLELWALENVWRLWQSAAWAAVIAVGWLLWNERALSDRGGPEFFERPDEIQRLGLNG